MLDHAPPIHKTTPLGDSQCGDTPPNPSRTLRRARHRVRPQGKIAPCAQGHLPIRLMFSITPAWLRHPPRYLFRGVLDVRQATSEDITSRDHGLVPGGFFCGHRRSPSTFRHSILDRSGGWSSLSPPPSARAGVPGAGTRVGSSANAAPLHTTLVLLVSLIIPPPV